MPRVSRFRLLTASGLLLLLALTWLLRNNTPETPPAAEAARPGIAALPPPPDSSQSTNGTPAASSIARPDPDLLNTVRSFRTALQAGLSRDEARARLQVIKQQVHDLPPETAAATLIALLESGEDAPTGLGFVIGNDGVLAESPTYRVALIDLLGQTEPDAITAYSRQLLNETTLPDEYAVALRNLAWLDHEGSLTREISTRFSTMLDRTDWRATPSTGYLEAFDIAVAVGGNGMVTELSSVLRLTTAQPALNRAAFVALDRIALREPQTLATIITNDPTFLDFAPDHRASLLSRLNPASPPEQAALRTYLSSKHADSAEIAYFSKIFPNANTFDSHRLVTPWETTTDTAPRRDAAALAFIDTLLADPAYVAHTGSLKTMRLRIQSFITP